MIFQIINLSFNIQLKFFSQYLLTITIIKIQQELINNQKVIQYASIFKNSRYNDVTRRPIGCFMGSF